MHDILAKVYYANDIQVRIVSEADTDLAILGLVRAGIGCAVFTYFPMISDQDISAIPIMGSGFQGFVCVGRRIKSTLPRMAEQFAQYLIRKGQQEGGFPC